MLFQFCSIPNPAWKAVMAHVRALLPGTEVRRDGSGRGDSQGIQSDDRCSDGAVAKTPDSQRLGVGKGRHHDGCSSGKVHSARWLEASPPGNRRAPNRRAYAARQVLGRWRRREWQEPPWRAADAASLGASECRRLMIPVASRGACEYKIHSFRTGPGRCPAPASSRREPGTNGLGVAPVSPLPASLTAVSKCRRNRGYYRRGAPAARLQEI